MNPQPIGRNPKGGGLLTCSALTTMRPDLHIELLHNAITVTMPGTNYTVTYHKPKDSPLLLAKNQSSSDDRRTSVTLIRVPWQCLVGCK